MMISMVLFMVIWFERFNVREGVDVGPLLATSQAYDRLARHFSVERLGLDVLRVAVGAVVRALEVICLLFVVHVQAPMSTSLMDPFG